MAEGSTKRIRVAIRHDVRFWPAQDASSIGRTRAECTCGQSAIYSKNDVATVAAEEHVIQGVPLQDA